MDCSALLTRQLAELPPLISRLRVSQRKEEAVRLLRQLSNRAVLHVLSRERLLLPAWRRAHWKDVPLDALVLHVRFKQALANLLVRAPHGEGFDEALTNFAQHVEQLHSMDRHRLIPVLRAAFDIHQRRELCNDIELLFDTGSPPSGEATRGDVSSVELIEEAGIVLTSIAP